MENIRKDPRIVIDKKQIQREDKRRKRNYMLQNEKQLYAKKETRRQAVQNKNKRGISKKALTAIGIATMLGIGGITITTLGNSFNTKQEEIVDIRQGHFNRRDSEKSGISPITLTDMMSQQRLLEDSTLSEIEKIENSDELIQIAQQALKERLAKKNDIKVEDIELKIAPAIYDIPERPVAISNDVTHPHIDLSKQEEQIIKMTYQLEEKMEQLREEETSGEKVLKTQKKLFNCTSAYIQDEIKEEEQIR